ncbi:MAG TPA: DUF5670 family protein [Candidatus Limnocylindrales bacterium]|nr:DUF5670 family protein [Candidatus Limnocylindrales bacterium]
MLWTIVVIFFVLWLLGLASVYSIGGWIWLFFVIWIVALIAQFAMGRSHRAPPSAV